MNRITLTRILAETLKKRFMLIELQDIRNLLDSGELGNIFSNAVDKAIESKTIEDKEN